MPSSEIDLFVFVFVFLLPLISLCFRSPSSERVALSLTGGPQLCEFLLWLVIATCGILQVHVT